MALELSKEEPEYEEIGYKFYEHFLQIASAMDRMGINKDELYDEEDGFYYDVLRLPNGDAARLKLRSLVGLLPIAASMVVTGAEYNRLPDFGERSRWLSRRYPEVSCNLTNIGSTALHVTGNPHAEDFYLACGFKQIGTTQTCFGVGLLLRKGL